MNQSVSSPVGSVGSVGQPSALTPAQLARMAASRQAAKLRRAAKNVSLSLDMAANIDPFSLHNVATDAISAN